MDFVIVVNIVMTMIVAQILLPQALACPNNFSLTATGRCRYQGPYPMATTPTQGAWRTLPYVKRLDEGLDPRAIALGHRLFSSRELSYERNLSCQDCHNPDHAFTDQNPQSIGGSGLALKRNSPSLYNMIFLQRFFWDGRAASPEEQLAGPLFSKDEMNMSPEKLWQRLLETPDLMAALKEVYPPTLHESSPESPQDWAVRGITDALVSYQATLLAFDSPYDRWALGDQKALTQDQFLGFNIFRSFVSRCAECHIPPLFTSGQLVVIGAPDHPKAGPDHGAGGAGGAGGGAAAGGTFKVPTLRNIALTAPYMHSGSFQTLGETLRFYNRGGGRALGTHMPKDLHWHIRPMTLSHRELQLLEIFLGSLTDRR